MKKIILFISFLIGTIRIAQAAASSTIPIEMRGELLRTLVTLIAIIALIFLARWLTRRLQVTSSSETRCIRCIESLSIGLKERLLLVQVGEAQLLIGIVPGSVSVLHMLTTPIDISTKKQIVMGFQQLFQQRPGT